ncbi:MalY/PatB family protein [Cognaticolwellia mytili]|uniref:MalY/PatB family protein n=1 Tax=Cognaticolwellia mytili TaxID=1888913 RepID=UPI000A177A9F|nr:aminotransferase class I/II-fold pyridoxal phosphate-dependent enzyme [Cognaticolwellia mytili]
MKFEEKKSAAQNSFIRNSQSMLKNIFGTTDVTPFWIADMDFTIAEPIQKELQRLVERNQYAYESDTCGVFEAITNWYQRRHNLTLNVEHFVQVPGVLAGIALLIRELTEKGDGVLIQTPAYHQFSKVISSAGREVVKSPLQLVNGNYEVDYDDLAQKLSAEHVKVMILCNPHNPVGRVLRKSEVEKIQAIAEKYDVTIISDEIHADIIHSGNRFNSLMASGANKHVAMIGSPAKTFGMQSISNGYIYTENQEIFDTMRNLTRSLYLDHGNALTTFATIAAFNHGDSWLDELLQYLQESISWITLFLSEQLPSVTMTPVEGTYQIWLDFSGLGFSNNGLITLFADAGFALSPGSWFDDDAGQFARMNIAAPKVDIENAFKRLKETILSSTGQYSACSGASSSGGCC